MPARALPDGADARGGPAGGARVAGRRAEALLVRAQRALRATCTPGGRRPARSTDLPGPEAIPDKS